MKKFVFAALIVVNGWLAWTPVSAAPVLSLVPTNSSIAVGGAMNVNLFITGLNSVGQIVSGFDLDVFFDPAVLQVVSLNTMFLPWGTGSDTDLRQNFVGPGHVEFKLTALLGDGILETLQGDSILLSTISFQGLANGFSNINYGFDANTERKITGRNSSTLQHETTGTCVAVGTGECATNVPEPATLPLMFMALAALGLALRRQHV